MAPAWIIIRGAGGGGGGRPYYCRSLSLCKRALLYQFFNVHDNYTESSISAKLLRSFTTTPSANDFDDLFHSDANNTTKRSTSFQSNAAQSPPHPIPNRPLRAHSNTFNNNKKTRPSYPPPPPQNPQFTKSLRNNENPNRDTSGADFLERFKLGFDNKDNTKVETNPNPQAEAEAEAEDADEIFKKMKETGLIPNAVAMLDGLCKDGLVQEAMKLFGLMREKGTIPEVVIYTAVVEGFCKAHKFDDAIRIFRKMQSNNIIPNAFSYGLLIQWLCKGKRFDDAVEFCVETLDGGHSLNLATFTSLVDGFCREKGLEDAKSVIATLRQKGFFFDEKAVREYLDKKGPFLPAVWEAIIGKKASQRQGDSSFCF